MSQWDLLIVGAGPAGAATAIAAARAGMKTVVIDAAEFPRQKVCGEYLTPAALELLDEWGLADVCGRAVPLTTFELTVDRRPAWSFDFDERDQPRSLSRWTLDVRLVEEAQRAGATILTGRRVRRIVVERGRAVAVECAGDGEHEPGERLDAKLIVAADGRRSVVVHDTGTLKHRDSGLIGFKRHVHVAAGHAPHVVALHALNGGYVGTCFTEDGALNVCGMMTRERLRAARGDVAAALLAWVPDRPQLQAYFSADGVGPWLSMPDVSCQSAHPHTEGVLYLGDALATIEPLAGQGMTLALASARLAGAWLKRHGTAVGDEALQRGFAAEWQANYARPIRRAAWFGRLLRNPGWLKLLFAAGTPLPGFTRRLLRSAHRSTRTVAYG